MNEGKTGYKVVKHAAAPKQPKVKKRNPVAKNAAAAIGGGAAGAHKDKKKAEKQGDTKHKKRVPADMMEGAAYDKRLELLLKIAQVKETLEEAKKGLYYNVNKRKKAGTSRSQGHPDAPSAQDWKNAAKTAKKESVEDRTSYQVAKELAKKGITYDPARESELIKAIGIILVKELNMSPTQARGVMNDEDFLGDTFGELKYMGQGVAEGDNPEYDDEAGMADNNLETLKRAVEGLDNLIGEGDNLPEWCQEKIAVAKSMLVTVWDYMESEEQHGKA